MYTHIFGLTIIFLFFLVFSWFFFFFDKEIGKILAMKNLLEIFAKL